MLRGRWVILRWRFGQSRHFVIKRRVHQRDEERLNVAPETDSANAAAIESSNELLVNEARAIDKTAWAKRGRAGGNAGRKIYSGETIRAERSSGCWNAMNVYRRTFFTTGVSVPSFKIREPSM